MKTRQSVEKFEILEEDVKRGVKFLSTNQIETISRYNNDIKMCDFKQSSLKNCALIAALAALSKRPEFWTEIAPKIIQLRNKCKYIFSMHHQGRPIKIIVDDALPFDKENSLVYARSVRNEKFLLASFFEKAFIKKACYKSYERSNSTYSLFAFSSFSDCMISCVTTNDTSLNKVLGHIKSEIDNNSSLVIEITPSPKRKRSKIKDDEVIYGHAFTIIDYNVKHNIIKLYNPTCNPKHCISDKKIPKSLTNKTSKKHGEFWASKRQLEGNLLAVISLHAQHTYKSVYKIDKNIQVCSNEKRKRFFSCKLNLKESSTIMVNFFSYTYELSYFNFFVKTTESIKDIELDYELKPKVKFYANEKKQKGMHKCFYNEKFKLNSSSYLFYFEFAVLTDDIQSKVGDFLIKIGSTSQCAFEKNTI